MFSDKVDYSHTQVHTLTSPREQHKSYLLQAPISSIATMTTTSLTSSHGISTSVPLLLNPDIMQSTAIQFVAPQVSLSACFNPGEMLT